MASNPLELILKAVSCSNCVHFDGDCHCSLPIGTRVVSWIEDSTKIVCVKWELEANDEEMTPHKFESRVNDVWCRHCEYHRDHKIHV